MWRWAVLWHASTLLAVGGTLDFRFYNQKRQLAPSSQINCYEYLLPTDTFGRTHDLEWRPQNMAVKNIFSTATAATFVNDPLLNLNEISRKLSRRFDRILPEGNDIVKEHAKLIQDINSLRQVVFVAPMVDDNKDYDDSIFHEIIETFTTTTPMPSTAKPLRSTKQSSIPIILLGGASQRQVVKSRPIKFPKPTISLVGTSVSPSKHPYPFVMQSSVNASPKPFKVCMPSMTSMYTTTRRPSLWQRLLNSLIPR